MLDSLEVLVEPLIRKRLEVLYGELLKSNAYYINLSTERDQYIQQLHVSIPADLQHTMFLLQDVQLSLQNIFEPTVYLRGFKDALYLRNEIHI
ncbi:hypothetical protein ABE142_05900 [Paenibacillus alvei]|uniref:hypothetical protein n=1 Tax=Paenibacillus alvei TaxID=44250 RepID=UPI003D28C1AB